MGLNLTTLLTNLTNKQQQSMPRPKGSKNKLTTEVKEQLQNLFYTCTYPSYYLKYNFLSA